MPAKEVVAPPGVAPLNPSRLEPDQEVPMDRTWRTIDIVTVAVLAVVSGVVFWAWNLVWTATGPLFVTLFPPAQALMYGVWLVPGVLGMLVIRRPGAALATAFLASVVSATLGSAFGYSVLLYGVLQGLAPELVFAVGRYRSFGWVVSMAAGAAAGVVPGVLDPLFWYPEWSPGWKLAWLAACVVSSALVAGLGSHFLVAGLARTGALDQFPIGQQRVGA